MRKNIYDFDGKLIGFMLEEGRNKRVHMLDCNAGGMIVFTHKEQMFHTLYDESAKVKNKYWQDPPSDKKLLSEMMPYTISNLNKLDAYGHSIELLIYDIMDNYFKIFKFNSRIRKGGKYFIGSVLQASVEDDDGSKFKIKFRSISAKRNVDRAIQKLLNSMPVTTTYKLHKHQKEFIDCLPDPFYFSKDPKVSDVQKRINRFNQEVLDRYKLDGYRAIQEDGSIVIERESSIINPSKEISFSDDPISKTLRGVKYEPPVEPEPIEIKEKTQEEKVDSAMKRFCR